MHKRLLTIIITLVIHSVMSAQVDVVGTQKLNMSVNGNTLKIPYFTSHSLTQSNADITSAVVVVHGANRDADLYFQNMTTAAAMRPMETVSTAIVAPQFLIEEDIDFHNLDQQHLYWSNGGWRAASISRDNSGNPRPERISSFAVLDTIMIRLVQVFPNLESIVFTGHSAGGQVAHRYAATSSAPDFLCGQYSVNVKFLVANPSSYLYLDNKRVRAGTTDEFVIPDNSCPEYNEWKFGLEELFSYPSMLGADSIRNVYGRRQVSYLLGGDDNDPNSNTLDVSCEARLQGNHRLERGTIYFNYLTDYYGKNITDLQSIDTIIGVGHNNLEMYTSEIGLFRLFETPVNSCDNFTSDVLDIPAYYDLRIYPNPSFGHIYIGINPNTKYNNIRLELYSILGEKVKVVDNDMKMDLSGLMQGSYFLKIEIDNRSKMEKILLVKD